MIDVAIEADGRSSRETLLRPPSDCIDIVIWSFLYSVGLITTLMPLERVHSVVPRALLYFSFTIVPAVGAVSTNGRSKDSSTGASISDAFTALKISRTSSFVGTLTISLFSLPI